MSSSGYSNYSGNQRCITVLANQTILTEGSTGDTSSFDASINDFLTPLSFSPLYDSNDTLGDFPFDGTSFLGTSLNTTINASDKTFVIDHPLNTEKHLVHACLEGPEAGVFYRGRGEILNGESVVVKLPSYVSSLAHDFTVHLTPIRSSDQKTKPFVLESSELVNGRFCVYGKNCAFFWLVHGQRHAIDVEPFKTEHQVLGEGPYRWISKK